MTTLVRLALRSRPVRLRFTLLYVVLFLGSAVALLALTNLLAGANNTESVPAHIQPIPQAGQQRIHDLETQLSDLRTAQSRQLLMGSLIALVVMAVVSFVLGNAVAGRVLRPLRTITAATRRISAENLHERLAVPGPADEVKNLADTIDGLLERLEASFAAQRGFVANASHELRTPLATMRASVDVALAKPEPPPPQTVALADRLRTELDTVDRLLEGLLVLARAQHGALAGETYLTAGGPVDRAPLSPAALVSQATTARAGDIAAKSLTVDDTGLQRAAWTEGSVTLLSRLAGNLIDNAIVHNEDGGWIRVATPADDATVRLIVETGGRKLDPEQVARLGRPFQRLTADRTGSGTGSGLGLSIVAAIAAAHGGRLDLHARPEGGLRATVTLPSAPEAGLRATVSLPRAPEGDGG
ncbi:HAMP domain-containing histidine kinase [Nonomuraea sp. K274]|uniref:histidine kinase n=1 Tax=Nonomuraea cypriaca TaxID=1187855 RepID=A0A931F5W0_9ACTN|nr:HAMP domain-containing sensor histidine kinase [Nonomuraea cypriaca]MBF8194077.1 HAMP domain-containing histidine kinase [Nonomuraea cypriaca]